MWRRLIFCAILYLLALSDVLAQFTVTNNQITLTISSGVTVTVAGNLTNNASSTINESGTLEVSGALTNSGTYNASGTTDYNGIGNQNIITIDYNNLTISGSGVKTLAGNTTVNADLTIENSSTLDSKEGSGNILEVKGDWLCSGGFNAQNGTVTFSGSSEQSITSNGQNFYNVTVDNAAGEVFLNDDLAVSNVLTLTNGVISTDTNKVIIASAFASALAGYSATRFINGNLRRHIAVNDSIYSFPIANGTDVSNLFFAQIFNGNLEGVEYIDARFKPLTNHNDADMTAMDDWVHGYIQYISVDPTGVWELEPDAQPSGGQYAVKLYLNNMSGFSDNEFGPLKRPAGSETAADWTTGGGTLNNHDGDGRLAEHGYMIRNGLTSFSEFGAGKGSGGGAGLPIELLSFEAKPEGSHVLIAWVTATETNNDYFTIEKSKDGLRFETVAIRAGAGNSSVTNVYQLTDEKPYPGISYYRLKQTDYDGAFAYSKIVSVNISVAQVFTIAPNPVTGSAFTVRHEGCATGGSLAVRLFDSKGSQVLHENGLSCDNTILNISLPSVISNGMYFVNIRTDDGESRKPIIINRGR